MGRLVSVVYNKHNYIDTAVSDSDIREVISEKEQQITLDGKTATPNQLALNEVADFIARNSSRHTKTSMKIMSITKLFLCCQNQLMILFVTLQEKNTLKS